MFLNDGINSENKLQVISRWHRPLILIGLNLRSNHLFNYIMNVRVEQKNTENLILKNLILIVSKNEEKTFV